MVLSKYRHFLVLAIRIFLVLAAYMMQLLTHTFMRCRYKIWKLHGDFVIELSVSSGFNAFDRFENIESVAVMFDKKLSGGEF